MKHKLKMFIRNAKDHSGSAEAIVDQGNGDAVSYRIALWDDNAYRVTVHYYGKWCGLYTEYLGDGGLDSAQLNALLADRLGESYLDIPAYLRRLPTFAA